MEAGTLGHSAGEPGATCCRLRRRGSFPARLRQPLPAPAPSLPARAAARRPQDGTLPCISCTGSLGCGGCKAGSFKAPDTYAQYIYRLPSSTPTTCSTCGVCEVRPSPGRRRPRRSRCDACCAAMPAVL